ncbi:winged helix DNA-binding protein [Novosphingobium sp. ZN18A2]|uniref:winged helix DNA-binding protein n=1 Tax=Novosphingobium sp. ZN18A2 TaxID=3079861 RepID=UPI0030CAE27D
MITIPHRAAHDKARVIYKSRRERDDCASGLRNLFGEPAWDILLDLFIAAQQGAQVQVSSVCLDANVPSTTLLRWLARLEREELITRAADDRDGRRRFVMLTERGEQFMLELLATLDAKSPAGSGSIV